MIKKLVSSIPEDVISEKISSPIGHLNIVVSAAGLHAIVWDNLEFSHPNKMKSYDQSAAETILEQTKQQLYEYFAGTRKSFDIPLAAAGTDFQKKAWQQLSAIPYGTTISYAEQAMHLGDKNKARAVGMANGLNPIPIIVPCHRVIGKNKKLVGFAGGIEKKKFLLDLEQRVVNEA